MFAPPPPQNADVIFVYGSTVHLSAHAFAKFSPRDEYCIIAHMLFTLKKIQVQ